MEYAELKEIAITYVYDKSYWGSSKEYLENCQVAHEDIKMANLLIRIETNRQDRSNHIEKLRPIFESCRAFQSENIEDNSQYIIFHPCTNPNFKYQLSYFDKFGAIMDEKSNSLDELINDYYKHYHTHKIVEVIN
ncbi:hypothetical protein [Clostridium tagluense]|uniref:Uncharacterized protein n=1 Tax=Clostridium tagluense TaxID=360422 RepID=A0A401USW7_9CLOT|nr:hypothetical protein [Clostridium tagluense]GCD12604.1 hypothetical protein Ctaglu_42270 [Clostridium tagluense]